MLSKLPVRSRQDWDSTFSRYIIMSSSSNSLTIPPPPLQAPPLAFRETGGFLSTQHDYFHTVKETCVYGSRGEPSA